MNKKWVGLMLGAMLCSGCLLRSLNPLYTDKDLVFKKSLVGIWEEAENQNTWSFEPADEKAYKLVQHQQKFGDPRETEPGESAAFSAHLLGLSEHLFLDIHPGEPGIRTDLYRMHLIPGHTFIRVQLDGDQLRLSMLDYDWLEDEIESGRVRIKHVKVDGEIVLSASTQDLQDLVQTYAEDKRAFPKPTLLRRKR